MSRLYVHIFFIIFIEFWVIINEKYIIIFKIIIKYKIRKKKYIQNKRFKIIVETKEVKGKIIYKIINFKKITNDKTRINKCKHNKKYPPYILL